MGCNTDLMCRWTRLCDRLQIAHDLATFGRLLAAYSESHRHYHTLEHLRWCFARVDELVSIQASDRIYTEITLWFHDAVYVVGSQDNERRSADMAMVWMRSRMVPFAGEVEGAILATKHTVAQESIAPLSAWTVDVDLSILGAGEADYAEYATRVAAEWVSVVGEDAYRMGRATFLRRMLETPRLFYTTVCVDRFETSARANMRRELAALES